MSTPSANPNSNSSPSSNPNPSSTPVPRLTLGLPVYNGERYLAQAVDALLAQSFGDFELIISDNASTDRTAQIAQAYADADPRVRYVRHPRNMGSAYNHNIVVTLARGELFKWVSDDDVYAPTLVQRCVEALDARPEVVVAHAWTAFIDDAGQVTHRVDYPLQTDLPSAAQRFRSLLYTQGGDDIYGVMRTSVIRQVYPHGSFHLADRTFVAELALHGPFHNVPEFLYFRRDHPNRAERIAPSLRLRCTHLDARRANRWRHPVVRLVAEYLLAYLVAIWRAPIGLADRLRCTRDLIAWVLRHADPLRRRRLVDSPDPAVQALGAKALATRLPNRLATRLPTRLPTRLRSRPVRRVALYGFLGSGNLGNDASFETVLGWLRAEHPAVAVSCITLEPAAIESRYGVPSAPLAVELGRSGPLASAAGTSAVGKGLGRLLDVPRSLRLAGTTDAVIVPGMGVLEESLGVRPWGLPLWMFLLAAACRLRGRRFVLLDVGAEPVAHPLTRRLFVATARLATHVSYRDDWSAEAMRAAGGRAPDAIAPDLAFAHPAPSQARPEPGLLVVGVMAYHGRDDDPVHGGPVRQAYVGALIDAVARLVDAGDQVVLLGGDRADTAVAHEIRSGVRAARPGLPAGAVVVRDVTTFAELTAEMARAEVVVASRFHNLICALRLARPTVSVGYAQKNTRLMQAVGLGAYCQEIETLDADLLVDHVRRARTQAAPLGVLIGDVTRDYAGEVNSLLDRVAGEVLGLTPARRSVAVA